MWILSTLIRYNLGNKVAAIGIRGLTRLRRMTCNWVFLFSEDNNSQLCFIIQPRDKMSSCSVFGSQFDPVWIVTKVCFAFRYFFCQCLKDSAPRGHALFPMTYLMSPLCFNVVFTSFKMFILSVVLSHHYFIMTCFVCSFIYVSCVYGLLRSWICEVWL